MVLAREHRPLSSAAADVGPGAPNGIHRGRPGDLVVGTVDVGRRSAAESGVAGAWTTRPEFWPTSWLTFGALKRKPLTAVSPLPRLVSTEHETIHTQSSVVSGRR